MKCYHAGMIQRSRLASLAALLLLIFLAGCSWDREEKEFYVGGWKKPVDPEDKNFFYRGWVKPYAPPLSNARQLRDAAACGLRGHGRAVGPRRKNGGG